MLKHFSRVNCLIIFSILKIISLAAYAVIAYGYEFNASIAPFWLYSVNAFEDACSAMLLVVMLTLIMQYSRKQCAGTDFTFQVSIMATISGLLYLGSGIIGDLVGYYHYLLCIVMISILCLLPIFYWKNNTR